MRPRVKQLLLLARKLAPIPGFMLAFATWGFVFSRYSDPPIDMAGRKLAASIAAASASAAAAKNAPGKRLEEEPVHPRLFTPHEACLQQQALFPSQFGLLDCELEATQPMFGWAWAPTDGGRGDSRVRLGGQEEDPPPKKNEVDPDEP